MAYRLHGHEDVDLSWEDLEQLIREGDLGPDTKVVRDGEDEEQTLQSRAEFRHLFGRELVHPDHAPGHPRQQRAVDQLECKYCRRRLLVREPLCPWCGRDLVTKAGEVSQYSRLTAPMFLGVHLGGHPALPLGAPVFVAADPDDLFFFRTRATSDRSIWIRRDAITAADVADETTVRTDQRLTLTRVALLGVLALAVPKRETTTHNRYVLTLRWDDQGIPQTALFQFDGPLSQTAAHAAHQFISSMRVARKT